MRYLTVGEVAEINESLVGPDHLGDFGLLTLPSCGAANLVGEDAYPDVHYKAAALIHSLARNHAFLDGNKRTALLAMVTFYGLNGYVVGLDDGQAVALALDVAEGQLDVPSIAGVLKNAAHPIEPTERA